MAAAQRMTVAEYLERDDERRTWLVDGEIVVNEPRSLHQHVAGDLYFALKLWCRAVPRPDAARSSCRSTSPLLPGFALALDELFGPTAA